MEAPKPIFYKKVRFLQCDNHFVLPCLGLVCFNFYLVSAEFDLVQFSYKLNVLGPYNLNSRMESFRELKFSKLESFRALNLSKLESVRTLKFLFCYVLFLKNFIRLTGIFFSICDLQTIIMYSAHMHYKIHQTIHI